MKLQVKDFKELLGANFQNYTAAFDTQIARINPSMPLPFSILHEPNERRGEQLEVHFDTRLGSLFLRAGWRDTPDAAA